MKKTAGVQRGGKIVELAWNPVGDVLASCGNGKNVKVNVYDSSELNKGINSFGEDQEKVLENSNNWIDIKLMKNMVKKM